MSGQAPKHTSEEDNSGSDSGSEISLEPETDRFGFILTNGSTSVSVGPSPELVRQREAKWINIIGQWDHILLKKSSKVKVQCQKGIPASLRAKCWSLLCGASEKMEQNKNLYESLDSQAGVQSWVDIIERDLDRQFPFHEMFQSKDGHGQRGLFRVLKAYTQYQPDEGYCQAQGPVAAVLLMNMPAQEAFWCLVQISEQYLPGYYSPLLEGVLFDAALLTWVLKRTCPAAHKHLQQHGVEPLMFATDWLMCLFTRHLPFNTLLRVWDLFFCYGVRVLLQVAVVLVRRVLGRAEQRKECQGQVETLETLRGVKAQVQEEDDAFIVEVCSVPLSAKDLEKRTEKELDKWRKDRPTSKFDPRARCHGYRMVWTRAREKKAEKEKTQKTKGNLTLSLARSASTLSLSPSLLRKKWRKVGKVSTDDPEGGKKVVRHLSMGERGDWKNWTDLNSELGTSVQEEEEDFISEGNKQQNFFTTTTEQEKLKTPNPSTEHAGEKVIVTLTPPCEEEEKIKTTSQSQVPQEQNYERISQDSEFDKKNKERDKPEADVEHMASVEDDHAEIQGEAVADPNTEVQENVDTSQIKTDIKQQKEAEADNVEQIQVDTVTQTSETKDENDLDSEEFSKVKDSAAKDLIKDTQQEQEELTTNELKPAFVGQNQSSEALAEMETTETVSQDVIIETSEEPDGNPNESNPELIATEKQRDSQREAESEDDAPKPASPEQRKNPDLTDDAETDPGVAAAQNIEKFVAEFIKEIIKNVVAELSETQKEACIVDQINLNETQGETTEENVKSVALMEGDGVNETAEPEDKTSEQEHTPDLQAVEQLNSQATLSVADRTESTEKVAQNTAAENNVFISTQQTHESPPDSILQTQDRDPDSRENQADSENRSLEKGLEYRRSSRSSSDFCMRRSSHSQGSRLARRLSEDLFTSPVKSSRPQCTTDPSKPDPGTVDVVKTDVDETSVRLQEKQPDNPKGFGLLRRLRGEKPKNTKVKMQVPKILIQDFSDETVSERLMDGEVEGKINSRERRRRRRENERKEKEEEKLKKKKEKLEKGKKKKEAKANSFQVKTENSSGDVAQPAKTGSHALTYADSYF
uniref:TBC1 domain family, member 10C n=1 Tax=Oryzias latipes TaxID=8090 RepID=A0A3P9IDF5_ORYLA